MLQNMRSIIQMYNMRSTTCSDIRTFRFLCRSASFSALWKSQESLQLRVLPCAPSIHLTPKLSLVSVSTNARVSSFTHKPALRYLSSHSPIHGHDRQVIALNDEEKLTLVQAEYELYKAEGEIEVPSHINDKEWEELVRLPSIMSRKRYFRFLFINEMKAFNQKEKNAEKRKYAAEKRLQLTEELAAENAPLSYGLWRNSIFLKFGKKSMNNIDSMRLMQAKLYGQPIIIDYDFGAHMSRREETALAKQVSECMSINRAHRNPYDLHFCNFREKESGGQAILKAIPTLLNEDYMVETHPEDYMDVFPKNKLVYLTPHCRDDMTDYDHNAVYIIGGIVDSGHDVPHTLAKAKRQNIQMRRFPLDRFLDWGIGRKSLTLNQVLGIMLEMKHSGSWLKAFEMHIPTRKLFKSQDADADAIRRKMRGRKSEPETTSRLVRSLFKE